MRTRTLDTNMNVVLLSLLDLAGIFIRFRERVCKPGVSEGIAHALRAGLLTKGLEVLDGHTTVGGRARVGGGVCVCWGGTNALDSLGRSWGMR